MYPYYDNTLYGVSMTLVWILTAVYYILVAVGSWKMFEKAGESGWKALIPFYNDYIRFKIAWQTKYFWIYCVLAVASSLLLFYGSEMLNMMMIYIGYALLIVNIVINCVLQYDIALAYGKGIGYALGLVLFPFLFTMIIGFGSAQYVGNRYDMAAGY